MNENPDSTVEAEMILFRFAQRERLIVDMAEHGIACFERLLQIEANKR